MLLLSCHCRLGERVEMLGHVAATAFQLTRCRTVPTVVNWVHTHTDIHSFLAGRLQLATTNCRRHREGIEGEWSQRLLRGINNTSATYVRHSGVWVFGCPQMPIALATGPVTLPPLLGQLGWQLLFCLMPDTAYGAAGSSIQCCSCSYLLPLLFLLLLLQRKSVNFQGYYYARLVGLIHDSPLLFNCQF